MYSEDKDGSSEGASSSYETESDESDESDESSDKACFVCKEGGGDLVSCTYCKKLFHLECHRPALPGMCYNCSWKGIQERASGHFAVIVYHWGKGKTYVGTYKSLAIASEAYRAGEKRLKGIKDHKKMSEKKKKKVKKQVKNYCISQLGGICK